MYKGMNFGGGNMQQLMRQAQKMQEQMQNQMAKAEEELQNTVVSGTSGGGMVTVEMTGKRNITKVTIKPEAVDPDDVEMLEDMVLASVNEALKKVDELESKLKGGVNGGMF